MTVQGETTWSERLIPLIQPAAVTDIIAGISDVALIISDTGIVKSILSNPGFAGHQGVEKWEGAPLQDSLNYESASKFEHRLAQFLTGSESTLPVELNHIATESRGELPIRYSFHATGADDLILMLGSDLRSYADMQQQLVAAQIALENDYELLREHDIRFRVLMESSSIATVLISAKSGDVVACNSAAEKLFDKSRDALMDSPFAKSFETSGRGDVVDRLVAAASKPIVSPVIAKLMPGNRSLSLTPTLFRGANGQVLLCKIDPSEGVADVFEDSQQAHLTKLYQNGVDAMVFVDAAGRILSANEAFPKLIDRTHSQGIQGQSIAEFFSRGSVDLNVILENTRIKGSMRMHTTRLVGEHGFERSVEISTTLLNASGHSIFGMIIREARRTDAGRAATKKIDDVDMQSVKELIGGQSLKEIVAKTTDVIEKMCIETAVEMTSNNRVAAAEMLGLSRQSLYVKLRKYDLIGRN